MKKSLFFASLVVLLLFSLVACDTQEEDFTPMEEVIIEEVIVEEVAEEVVEEVVEEQENQLQGSYVVSVKIKDNQVTILSFPSDEELTRGDLTLKLPVLRCLEQALVGLNAAGLFEADRVDIKITVDMSPDGSGIGHIKDVIEDEEYFDEDVVLNDIHLSPLAAAHGTEHSGCKSSWGICTEDKEDPCPLAEILGTCYETECHRCLLTDKGALRCACSPTNRVKPCP